MFIGMAIGKLVLILLDLHPKLLEFSNLLIQGCQFASNQRKKVSQNLTTSSI